MKNIRLIIQFEGTKYSGWQSQKSGNTVQDAIENRIMILTQEKVKLHSSGRTDAGVHAEKMFANFIIEKELDLGKFKVSLNCILPDDIVIMDVAFVDLEFHSRRSAKKKVYEYRILNSVERSPFLRDYSWHVREPLDISRMKVAAKALVGEHDFISFSSTGGSVKTTVRTVHEVDIRKEGELIWIRCVGSGFLKQMVRNMVGLLVQIGTGRFGEDFVAEVFIRKSVEKPYVTAPARGLFLMDVLY